MVERRWIILLLIQPILYIYGLQGEFVFDDRFLILDTLGQNSLKDAWLGGLWVESGQQANFYRPLFSTSIILDQWLFGHQSVGYHLHSLLWHICNLFLFFRLARGILPENSAWIASCVFATHPLLSETVFWISARNDTMVMTFVLGFLNLLWVEQRSAFAPHDVPSFKTEVQLLGLFICGMLCKESALVLFLPILAMYAQTSGTKRLGLMMMMSVIVLFAWRKHIGIETPEMEIDALRQIVTAFGSFLVDGFGRMVFPWRLSPATPVIWLQPTWQAYIFCTLWIGMIGFAVQKDFANVWWVVWLIVGVVLALPVIVYTGNTGDRYWSLSLVAWSLLLGQVLPNRWFWIPMPFWMAMIFLRGQAWTSDLEFWSQEVQMQPSPYAHVSLAIIQYNQEDYTSAMTNFYQGFQADPPHLDGCVPFVSSVLAVQGASSAIEASQWALSRGCPQTGEMVGLQAVMFAGVEDWKTVAVLLAGEWVDPVRRLDVVRALRWAREEEWRGFCEQFHSWDEPDVLLRQLSILSPTQFMNTSALDWEEFCSQ